MNFFARARTGFMSWMHETPLPSTEAYPNFQSWHHFDPVQQWVSWVPTRLNNTNPRSTNTENIQNIPKLVLLTWNIDATSSQTQARVTEIITFITDLDPKVDVVFLQEVSKTALRQLLGDARVRESWLSSERDDTAWGKQSFATVTLVSKARFASNAEFGMNNAILGPIWRVKYPSHFDRDALCCDIFVPSPTKPESESKPSSATRIRLINVHLDSLPIQPSYRPRQISIVSSFLHAAGYGIVAGDFNPVLEEDATLIENSGLTDVWTSLRSKELGYTWGVDGEQPFPPNRLDKVAVLGLTPSSIRILQPGDLSNLETKSQQAEPSEDVPWSDHHAFLCTLNLPAK
ncbi:uncharacterized protein N7446_000278 [Penicillium canescens]|uniref:Endonuclease/exonuclease/phosphatase domain-containing protein n=1 Tax=Penicillium canescens TaxID=5083 RepID=A0AAD6I4T2_PENCN|nr:uncharacterized protein N7446_000278 [Penicillium canescens]KAJ6030660.1 hypothetical protein N7460_010926 [Penicillium canescens]KAJ6059624.1 hypothetical protein N7444_003263 [Penicillium canescens]KAJ6077342.1 hypothetical protein N7446_000278 [Penicillium canescens]